MRLEQPTPARLYICTATEASIEWPGRVSIKKKPITDGLFLLGPCYQASYQAAASQ